MCKVSDTLKLCTCVEDKNIGNNRWIFYKYNQHKNIFVIGQVTVPFFIDPAVDLYNKETLLGLINTPETFDKPLNPETKDRLMIQFMIAEKLLEYGFEYTGNRWKHCKYDPLQWQNKYDEKKVGSVE